MRPASIFLIDHRDFEWLEGEGEVDPGFGAGDSLPAVPARTPRKAEPLRVFCRACPVGDREDERLAEGPVEGIFSLGL